MGKESGEGGEARRVGGEGQGMGRENEHRVEGADE